MLGHVQDAHDLILKRKTDKEAEEKRLLAEAEETLQTYLTCEEEHPEVVEKLADAATLLGWHPSAMTGEAQITTQLSKTFDELDGLECRYREALANLKAREAELQRRGLGRDARETPTISFLEQELYLAAQKYEERWNWFDRAWRSSRVRRSIPARYLLAPRDLVASSHPPAELPLSERNKPEPLRLPERPDIYDLHEKVNEAANDAQAHVYKQAIEEWEAAAQKCTDEHEEKVKAHEAWVAQEKAKQQNAKQKPVNAES